MALTLTELLSKLKQIDEVSLLEILDISSEELVERFSDIIENQYDSLVQDFEAEESD